MPVCRFLFENRAKVLCWGRGRGTAHLGNEEASGCRTKRNRGETKSFHRTETQLGSFIQDSGLSTHTVKNKKIKTVKRMCLGHWQKAELGTFLKGRVEGRKLMKKQKGKAKPYKTYRGRWSIHLRKVGRV